MEQISEEQAETLAAEYYHPHRFGDARAWYDASVRLAKRVLEAEAKLLAYRESGALARSIAEAMFTNGSGEKAERLVLELPGKRDGGGWCRKAVEDVIKRELEASHG